MASLTLADLITEGGIDGRTELSDCSLWRERRQHLLLQIEGLRGRSGRFIGVIGADAIERGEKSEKTLAQALGIERLVRDLFERAGTALCPRCEGDCRRLDLEMLSGRDYPEGILLISVALEFLTPPTRAEIEEQASYWQAARVSDGSHLWALENLDQCNDFQRPWYVVLDSIKMPAVVPELAMRIRSLFQRSSQLARSGVTLLFRATGEERFKYMGHGGNGWYCDRCRMLISPELTSTYRLEGFRSDSFVSRSFNELHRLAQMDGNVTRAFEIVRRIGMVDCCFNQPMRGLSAPHIVLVQLAAMIVSGISDTTLIIDDIAEILSAAEEIVCDGLVSELCTQRNQAIIVKSGIPTRSSSERAISIGSAEMVNSLRPGRLIDLGAEGFNQNASYREFRALYQAVLDSGVRSVDHASVVDLRRPFSSSLAALCSIDRVVNDLIERSLVPSSARGRGALCSYCLGSGGRVYEATGREPCACTSSSLDTSPILIKGGSIEYWAHTAIIQISEKLTEYRQTSRLLRAVISLELGAYTLATSLEGFYDLKLQALRLLTLAAAPEVDLYKRAKKRREGAGRLMLLYRPFWGLGAEISQRLRDALESVISPNDTIAYLDSSERFKIA